MSAIGNPSIQISLSLTPSLIHVDPELHSFADLVQEAAKIGEDNEEIALILQAEEDEAKVFVNGSKEVQCTLRKIAACCKIRYVPKISSLKQLKHVVDETAREGKVVVIWLRVHGNDGAMEFGKGPDGTFLFYKAFLDDGYQDLLKSVKACSIISESCLTGADTDLEKRFSGSTKRVKVFFEEKQFLFIRAVIRGFEIETPKGDKVLVPSLNIASAIGYLSPGSSVFSPKTVCTPKDVCISRLIKYRLNVAFKTKGNTFKAEVFREKLQNFKTNAGGISFYIPNREYQRHKTCKVCKKETLTRARMLPLLRQYHISWF